jgi:type 1 glutamine amidotransferase
MSLLVFLAVGTLAAHAEKPARSILFFSKSSGFEHSVISYKNGQPSHAEKVLLELGKKENWAFTFSKDGSKFSPDYLKGFDAVVFYTTGDLTTAGTDGQPPMSAAGKQALLDYVRDGGAFAGTHSASDTFHTNNESKKGPDRYLNHGEKADDYVRMLGGEFIKHGAQQAARVQVVDPAFPGLEKIGPSFELMEEWYSLKDFSPDLHVLLLMDTSTMKGPDYERPSYPGTWARNHGKGRVFYTSMGHREDVWTNPLFQDVLVGGLSWAMGDAKAEIPPNLEKAAPGAMKNPAYYEPAPPKKNSKAPVNKDAQAAAKPAA